MLKEAFLLGTPFGSTITINQGEDQAALFFLTQKDYETWLEEAKEASPDRVSKLLSYDPILYPFSSEDLIISLQEEIAKKRKCLLFGASGVSRLIIQDGVIQCGSL